MRICAAVLVLTVLAGGAPAAPARRTPEAMHATAHPLARLRVAADRALTVDPVAMLGRLPSPLGWMAMLGGFGIMGTALRGIRRPPAQALDAWRVGGAGARQ